MSVMISDDKNELFVTCKCGCHDAIHIKIDDEDKDSDYYAIMTYMSGNWSDGHGDTIFGCIKRKLKKIWFIIRNKDYYYSDVLMSCKDFEKFKEYVNQFGDNDTTIQNCIDKIRDVASRIENNCEEKSGTDGYRMYDDICVIQSTLKDIDKILNDRKEI